MAQLSSDPDNSAGDDAIDVDVWCWPLHTTARRLELFQASLSDAERYRAKRFLNPRHGEGFAIAHGGLREILSSYLGVPPASLAFTEGAHGKPRLVTPDGASDGRGTLQFNLTHSGQWATLAVSGTVEVGIDIEEIRPLHEDIAERFFAAEEISALRQLPADEQIAGFFRCWTRKEAVVKATGAGLSLPLTSFAVDLAPAVRTQLVRDFPGSPTGNWQVLSFAPADGYAGALAVRSASVINLHIKELALHTD